MDAKKVTIIAAVVILAVLVVFLVYKSNNGLTGGAVVTDYDHFAKCLTEKGVKMYGAFWCSHCQAQKKDFGTSWQYVNYVECSNPDGRSQTGECTAAGINGYPTWDFGNGVRQEGEVSFADLSDKSGCSL